MSEKSETSKTTYPWYKIATFQVKTKETDEYPTNYNVMLDLHTEQNDHEDKYFLVFSEPVSYLFHPDLVTKMKIGEHRGFNLKRFAQSKKIVFTLCGNGNSEKYRDLVKWLNSEV